MDSWKLTYDKYTPSEEGLREALCTLGNGYFASRGTAEDSSADAIHYPGTYMPGGYNRLISNVAGRQIENEDLVNWPNWLSLSFRVEEDSQWFQIDNVNILEFKQILHLGEAVLEKRMVFSDNKGRKTELISRRLISMHNPHCAALSWNLTPLNWEGSIYVKSSLDGSVKNSGVARYSSLNGQHLNIVKKGSEKGSIYILARTNQSGIEVAQAAKCSIYRDGKLQLLNSEFEMTGDRISALVKLSAEQNQTIEIEKKVTFYSSRDFAISEPLLESLEELERQPRFMDILLQHKKAWKSLWRIFDIRIGKGEEHQMILRLHIFHLLQTCSPNTIGLDTGIPARGWHGEAYRGHIFWDEIFIFPLLNLHMPHLTRSLILYRYHRLNAARKLASKNAYRGAMFPWQSGSNGREESQQVHLNPQSGKWIPDNTYLQRHVNLAIAYNVWQYYQATADIDFMKFYGVELLVEISRFFADLCSWNKGKKRYEINGVVGPDEFHTAYPGSTQPGINNNSYTNILASWLFSKTLTAIDLLEDYDKQELFEKLKIFPEEPMLWEVISRKLFVPFINTKIISQFEGYEDLQDFPWKEYRKKYSKIARLDRILDAEGDNVNNYKASKQADVLMLFYLFSADEIEALFKQLDYDFSPSYIPANVEYYFSRTSDGSTLSRLVRSWVQSRTDRKGAWYSFTKALYSDIKDIQGGTTPEGIHLGAMAGTVDILQRCFSGIEMRDDVLWFNPALPEQLGSVSFRLCYRGQWLQFFSNGKECRIMLEGGKKEEIHIGIAGEIHILPKMKEQVFSLAKKPRLQKNLS